MAYQHPMLPAPIQLIFSWKKLVVKENQKAIISEFFFRKKWLFGLKWIRPRTAEESENQGFILSLFLALLREEKDAPLTHLVVQSFERGIRTGDFGQPVNHLWPLSLGAALSLFSATEAFTFLITLSLHLEFRLTRLLFYFPLTQIFALRSLNSSSCCRNISATISED